MPDGRPHATNVLYAVIDGRIGISVTDDRVKTANLRRDPRAGIHVEVGGFWRWVVLEGEATLSQVAADPADEAARMLREVYQTISGGPHPDWSEFDQAMINERRLTVWLRPSRAYGRLD